MFGRVQDDIDPRQADGKAVAAAADPGQDRTDKTAGPQGAAPHNPATDRGEYTVISTGLKIVGTIEGDGDIVVDGKIEGNITGRMLTIGQGATVNGEVNGETAHIRGKVSGKISARTVMLASAARVKGDITYENLSVELGAMWDGRSQLRKPESATKQAATTAAAKPVAKPEAKPEAIAQFKDAPGGKTNGADKTGEKTMKDISAAA